MSGLVLPITYAPSGRSSPNRLGHQSVITLFRASIVAVVCSVAAGCTASYPTEPTKAEPVALYVAFSVPKGRAAPGSNTVINGYSFIAYTIDRDGVYERVSNRTAWSSSNDAIARTSGGVTTSGTQSFLAVS